MECTQRLECTQDLNPESYSQRTGPEQIGYLGILGTTYPVNNGPNKIGRDPQTCNIVLDMKSLSRQHAVINVLNKKDFMLMDLGSINKTKIGVKTLQPYISYRLQNGDTVQFGEVFGIFRLFEDDTDLPMTQDIGIPDTPIHYRHVTKFGASTSTATTIVPESPDVSDKDDSFIVSSQQAKGHEFKSPKSHFLKPSARTIIKPCIGTSRINNDFWNSAEKSPSLKLNLDDSSESFNDSTLSENTMKTVISNSATTKDIHEMETQVPYGNDANETAESIYTANTQLPLSNSPSIYSLETQLQLPVVKKVNEQHEMQFELSIANKENDVSIHNAHTQLFEINDIYNAETQATMSNNKNDGIHNANTELFENNDVHRGETQAIANKKKEKNIHDVNTQLTVAKDSNRSLHDVNTQIFNNHNKINDQAELEDNSFCRKGSTVNVIDDERISESDEELLFGEFDNRDIEIDRRENTQGPVTDKGIDDSADKRRSSSDILILDETDGNEFDNLDSQPLLLPETSPNKSSDKENMPEDNSEKLSPIMGVKRNKMRIDSDSSTDCDDFAILPTQKCLQNAEGDDDGTDCKDISINKGALKNNQQDSNVPNEVSSIVSFEEMATQILDDKIDDTCFEDMATQIIDKDDTRPDPTETTMETNKSNGDCFEDMATQIIVCDMSTEKELPYSEEIVSPFKIPAVSPIKNRKKQVSKLATRSMSFDTVTSLPSTSVSEVEDDDDGKYYVATQDIFDDLCSQKIPSPENENTEKKVPEDDEVVPSSVEDFIVGDRFRHIDDQLSPQESPAIADRSSDSIDTEENVKQYVSSLSSKQIKDVVGVEDDCVTTLVKKSSNELSDLEVTPKKYNPFKLMNIELPNSQEIKTNVTWNAKSAKTESSSDSELDSQESQECTPILFKKKVRTRKADAKIDLIAKFTADALPTRVLTRIRKPTAKAQEYNENAMKTTETILKPSFLTEQEDNIDKDIITENITRLKTKKNKSTEKATQQEKGSSNSKVHNSKSDIKNKTSKNGHDEKNEYSRNNKMISAEKEKKVAAANSVSKSAQNDTNKKIDYGKGQSEKTDEITAETAITGKTDKTNNESTTVNVLDISKLQQNGDDKNPKNNKRKSAEKDKVTAKQSVPKPGKDDNAKKRENDNGRSDKKDKAINGSITVNVSNSSKDESNNESTTVNVSDISKAQQNGDDENPKNTKRKSAEKDKVTPNKSFPKPSEDDKGKKRDNDNGRSDKKDNAINESITVNVSNSSRAKDNGARKFLEKEEKLSKSSKADEQNQSKISDFYNKEKPKQEKRYRSKRGEDKPKSVTSDEMDKNRKEKLEPKNKLGTKEIEEIINLDSEPEDTQQSVNVRSKRSTRNKNKTERESKSPEKVKEQQKRKYSKREKKSSTPPPQENTEQIRRSKRQKVLKDSQDSQHDSQSEINTRPKSKPSKDSETEPKTSMTRDHSTIYNLCAESNPESQRTRKRAAKEHLEAPISKRSETEPKTSLTRDQSTIYNISGESNPESPRTRKRAAKEQLEVPIPKRTRSAMASTSVTSRMTPAKTLKTLNVLFTAFPHDEEKSKLVKLGAVIVTDASECSVLVTVQIKRTFKLLCVVGLGKPIVGPSWVQACVNNNMLVDPWLYLMRDEAAETRFHFNLERTLTGRRSFLKGYNVSSTPSVMPQAPEMKLIVESSGGTWKEGGPQWLCVSTFTDKLLWSSLKRRGAIIVSTELILGGVLRQKLDIDANKLR